MGARKSSEQFWDTGVGAMQLDVATSSPSRDLFGALGKTRRASTRPDDPPASREPRVRVIVVATEPLGSSGLAALLERGSSIVAARDARHLADVPTMLNDFPADVVVWCADEVDATALSFAEELRSTSNIGIIMLVHRIDYQAMREVLAFGASGYALILRRSNPDLQDLYRVILELKSGRVTLTSSVMEQLVATSAHEDDPFNGFSPGEHEVLELLALGLRNCEIAARIGRSEKLVEKYVSRIFSKLGFDRDARGKIDRRVAAARLYLLRNTSARPLSPGAHRSRAT